MLTDFFTYVSPIFQRLSKNNFSIKYFRNVKDLISKPHGTGLTTSMMVALLGQVCK